MTKHDECHEVEKLVGEMDRVDTALGLYLAEHASVRVTADPGTPALEYARLQIQAWCAAAARRGAYDTEVLAATLHAIETMTRTELAAFIRSLAGAAFDSGRPAA